MPTKLGKLWRCAAHCDQVRKLAIKVAEIPSAASQSRIAFSSIASNTGARSPGEELMTCNTSAVAVCCASASSRSALLSASCRWRSAMSCLGSANVLSGVALICGPRRDQCSRRGSYRDRHGPPQVVDRDDQVTPANAHSGPSPGPVCGSDVDRFQSFALA